MEAIAGPARRLAEARRLVAASILYPLIVFLVAWGAFVFFTAKIAGPMLSMFRDFHVPGQSMMAVLVQWGHSAGWWGRAVPLVVVVLVGVWWFLSSRAGLVEPSVAGRLLGWLPWTGRMLRQSRVASFADVLAMLIESRVPLPESMTLAAEAVGGDPLVASARQMAATLQRGEPLTTAHSKAPACRRWPLGSWLPASRGGRSCPPCTTRPRTYHQRARFLAEKARVFVPIFLTVVIGGGAVAIYAALVFGSWISILKTLAMQ